MDNKYYRWWKENKPKFALIPAIVFWVTSMIFFVAGLKFENPLILFGNNMTMAIAVALSVSNTVIQIIGNEQEAEGMGLVLYVGWLASYALGISTNVNGLLTVFNVSNVYLEWTIALSLGSMIEVLPEKFLVQFLQNFHPTPKQQNRPSPQNHQVGKPVYRPNQYPATSAMHKIPRNPDRQREEETPPWLKNL